MGVLNDEEGLAVGYLAGSDLFGHERADPYIIDGVFSFGFVFVLAAHHEHFTLTVDEVENVLAVVIGLEFKYCWHIGFLVGCFSAVPVPNSGSRVTTGRL